MPEYHQQIYGYFISYPLVFMSAFFFLFIVFFLYFVLHKSLSLKHKLPIWMFTYYPRFNVQSMNYTHIHTSSHYTHTIWHLQALPCNSILKDEWKEKDFQQKQKEQQTRHKKSWGLTTRPHPVHFTTPPPHILSLPFLFPFFFFLCICFRHSPHPSPPCSPSAQGR